MRHTILIASKEETLLGTRALLLESTGYSTLKASTLTGAVGLAFYCHMAIIDKTFTTKDHEDFVDRVHRDCPNLVVLCLRTGLIDPQVLIQSVTDCLAAKYDGPKVVVIDDPRTPPCQEEPS
jgi:hypothetical protein